MQETKSSPAWVKPVLAAVVIAAVGFGAYVAAEQARSRRRK
jgi:hypothetical protein